MAKVNQRFQRKAKSDKIPGERYEEIWINCHMSRAGPIFCIPRKPPRKLPGKLEPSRHQVEILHKCQKDRALLDLMAIAGRSDRTKFRDQVLNPLIDAGLATMTIPNRPRSSKQRYRLTEKGREWLDSYRKGVR